MSKINKNKNTCMIDVGMFSIYNPRADGDCLFDCIGKTLDYLNNNYNHQSKVITQNKMTPLYLRQVVACQWMKDMETICECYELSKYLFSPMNNLDNLTREEIENINVLRQEHVHIQPLKNGINKNSIEQVGKNMCDMQLYWGDDYALKVFQKQTKIRILVYSPLDMTFLYSHKQYLDEPLNRFYYVILLLHKKHYSLLYAPPLYTSPVCQYHELPLDIQKFVYHQYH